MFKEGNLLIFVVGKSGSGKDTIMRKTVSNLSNTIPIVILQRVITRPPDKNEESIYLQEEEFLKRKEDFALAWFIYGNWYGCPKSTIENNLKQNKIVLINVSREILSEARKKYPQSKIVLIQVPELIAETRIKKRGREEGEMLNLRLKRMKESVDMPPPDLIISNDGELQKPVSEFTNYLKDLYKTVLDT